MHNIFYLGLSGERWLPFGLLVYPILFILSVNDDMHESLGVFEIWSDLTTDFGNDEIDKSLDELEIGPDPITDHRVSCS